jgi:hypothetical protein
MHSILEISFSFSVFSNVERLILLRNILNEVFRSGECQEVSG